MKERSIIRFEQGIKSNNENIMQEKQIQFVNSTKETIFATTDGARLEQVFNNLIRNSVDFVPEEGGKIEIGARGDNKKVVCYVKDNGIGIPKEKQSNLFNRFYQVDSSLRRKHGGTGLGLLICKGIVEGLGGKIWVESNPNKGSVFYFEIPKIREGEKMKILGIDDNEDLLSLCEITLSSKGHEYTGINNGREGVQAIKDKKFDVVLLDLSMPEFSGSDVIDALVKEDIIKNKRW